LLASASSAHARYRAHRCPQLAAAISYHVLFALVPLFTFFATIFGLVLRDPERRAQLIDNLIARFPLTAHAGVDLDRILSELPTPVSAIGVLSIVAVLWSASGMMASVRVGLTAALGDDRGRPFFQSKLVDVLLVLAVAVLLLVSFGVSLAVNAVERWSDTVDRTLSAAGFGQGGILGYVVPPIVAFVVFLLLYRLVPPSRLSFRDLCAGALPAAVGLELVSVGFNYYLTTFAPYDAVYGALGSVFAFLFAVYLFASVFLFGAEFAAAWAASAVADVPGAPGPPISVRRRLLWAIRGLFVRT
jgi:membrane protein